MSNVVGQSYALTVLTPIVAGREIALRAHLRGLPVGAASPLASLRRTHFARWVIVPQPAFHGAPMRPDPWKSEYLVFTSCFDGELDSYLEEIRTLMADEADAVWGHCVGYPGTAAGPAFGAYLRHNQIDTAVYFSAYPDATVAQVLSGLDLRARVLDLAIVTQRMGDAELLSRFRETFGDDRR